MTKPLAALLADPDAAREANVAYYEAARRKNAELNAYLWLPDEPPEEGVAIAVKDNIVTKGVPTTAGSKILEGYRPPYDATVISRLERNGFSLLGKTNLDEFAMGSSNENSAYGPVKNPRDTTRVPGGSSGGSAAAVAAGTAPGALGSDTGGSIREPAAFCGVVGMKPTYGVVSRYGLIAFASSLDQIGPITNSVADAATLLKAIAGYDERDSTSVAVEIDWDAAARRADFKDLRVGLPREYLGEGIQPEVRDAVRKAADAAASAGAKVEETSLGSTEVAVATYYLLATAEASANLARFDGIRYGPREARETLDATYRATRAKFGREVRRRILLGTFVLSAGYADRYYKKALAARTLVKRDFERAFRDFDVLLTPTTPTTAFRLGEKIDDPLQMYLSDVCTIPANLAGIPAISIPFGCDRNGLPIGIQLMAKPFADAALLSAARAFEAVAPRLPK